MLKNFFVVAFRNLRRNALFSLINILGFAIGLAVFLLISLLVLDDLMFDGFHEDQDNIYRVITSNVASGKVDAITSGALLAAANEQIPDAIAITRVHNFGRFSLTQFGAGESEAGILRRAVGADSNFFKVFPSFELIAGDPMISSSVPIRLSSVRRWLRHCSVMSLQWVRSLGVMETSRVLRLRVS